MVATSTEPARLGADYRVNDRAFQQPELRQVQLGLFLVGSDNAHEVVKDLGHADGSQLCARLKQRPRVPLYETSAARSGGPVWSSASRSMRVSYAWLGHQAVC